MKSNTLAGLVHLRDMAAATHYPTITGALSHICHKCGRVLHILSLYFLAPQEFIHLPISRRQSTPYDDQILH